MLEPVRMTEGASGPRGWLRLPWRYEDADRRDLRFDFLRGYALFAMMVDHLDVGESWFHFISGRAEFYTSAAEGFYFISGLVLGIISSRRELGDATRSILRRGWQLYLTVIGISLGFAVYGSLSNAAMWGRPPDDWSLEGMARFVASVLTLRETFHDGGIIALYAVTMPFAALAVWACHARKAWLALTVSATIYTVGTLYRDLTDAPFAVEFHPATWQTLFVTGLVIGFHRQRVTSWAQAVPRAARVACAVVLFAAGLFFLWVHAAEYALMPELPEMLGERGHRLGPLRLGLIALYFAVFFLIVHLLWKPLGAALGWFLVPIGQNSLWTFVVHLGLIDVALNVPLFQGAEGIWAGTLKQTLILAVLWGAVKVRGGRGSQLARRRVWAGVGLALAYVAVVTPFAGADRADREERTDDWLREHQELGWRRWVAYPDMEPEEARERLKHPHGAIEYGSEGVFVLAIDDEDGRRIELVIDGEFEGEHPLTESDSDGVQRSEISVDDRVIRVAVLRGRWATVDMLPRASEMSPGP